jgi:hypothetical protein
MDFVRTDVSEESIAYIIRVKRIDHLGTLALTAWKRTSVGSYVNVLPSSPILATLMIEEILSFEKWVLRKPHGVTFQNTAYFKYGGDFNTFLKLSAKHATYHRLAP